MSAIFETYNRAHNILELADILPNVSFTTSARTTTRLKKILKFH